MNQRTGSFEDYQGCWRNIRLERAGGVLTMTLHTTGGPLLWGARAGSVHDQIGRALREIARDRENRVMIFTGCGDAFCAGMDLQDLPGPEEPDAWLRLMREGKGSRVKPGMTARDRVRAATPHRLQWRRGAICGGPSQRRAPLAGGG